MEGNRPKPAQTVQGHLLAVEELRVWCQENSHKIPQVLTILAENAKAQIAMGRPPAAEEVFGLWKQHSERFGDARPDQSDNRWLRTTLVQTWWDARSREFQEILRNKGLEWAPVLDIKSGGGRGNVTTYRLWFARLEEVLERERRDEESQDVTDAWNRLTIRYRIEPARLALWARWLESTDSFNVANCHRTDHALPSTLTTPGSRTDQHRQPADHSVEGLLSTLCRR